jgi:hypothetical protein
MHIIRRIYLYAVALISLELALWGVISLLRTVIKLGPECTFSNLSVSLALILVGAPIFLLHWLWIVHLVRHDETERGEVVRAGFLYGTLLATLIPVAQNVLTLINRGMLQSAGMAICQPLIGGEQTWIDNLIAIGLNLLAAGIFFLLLRRDWQLLSERGGFMAARRLFRYTWMLYGLTLTLLGLRSILGFLFALPTSLLGKYAFASLLDSTALIVVGTPIWIYAWKACQDAMAEAGERDSILRRVVLYLLALLAIPFILASAGGIFGISLDWLFGRVMALSTFTHALGSNLSTGLPIAVLGIYYGGSLVGNIRGIPDPVRRAEWRRPYLYVLAVAGLVMTFVWVKNLLVLLGSLLVFHNLLGSAALSVPLGNALAGLLIGLFVWISGWGRLQAEAQESGEAGDHARRSMLRKFYLFAAVFSCVIGAMITTIIMVTALLEPLFLKTSSGDLLFSLGSSLGELVLFGIVLIYHLVCLRRDGAGGMKTLAARQEQFAVLVLDPADEAFTGRMTAALHLYAPHIPCTVQNASQAIPAEKRTAFKAIILPARVWANPPEVLRRFLKGFDGQKIVVGEAVPGWTLTGLTCDQAARITRQMAEGQEVRLPSTSSSAMILLYVVLAIVGLIAVMIWLPSF